VPLLVARPNICGVYTIWLGKKEDEEEEDVCNLHCISFEIIISSMEFGSQ
jgi:hypothetical protein